jgi:beta-galactosidase
MSGGTSGREQQAQTDERAGARPLPEGVRAVWDLAKAHQESTPTRGRVCINGLWRWQPASDAAESLPAAGWGYFKVPGSWPGISSYMQKDCQTVHAHPDWQGEDLKAITAAWYQREVTVPRDWAGRRVSLCVEYLNSYAAVYVDGKLAGELRYPAGELDLTSVLQPGRTHVLSMLVIAMPLQAVMLSYHDTASSREVKGAVARRGLCGDVYLVGEPVGARLRDVRVDTSVQRWEITVGAGLEVLAVDREYVLRAEVTDQGRVVHTMESAPFGADDLKEGRLAFAAAWKPENLWDIHTPGNTYHLSLSLLEAGKVVDTALPVRFGFREFWVDGRDFYLNGTRLYLSAQPFDNAQVGAMASCYQGAKETLQRFQSFGINFVYGHNYGCEPGAHLAFEEILRAADDVGMLFALSQPHFGHYDWEAEGADETNGYAGHAAWYVRVAGSHPSVVAYSTSHNATGYSEDMNPDLIDGIHNPRDNEWSLRNARRALRAEAIIKDLDPARIVYHHSSGNLSPMHTTNFYPNFVPIQEMSDWFEHWATEGAKPLFTVEFSAPFTWDWSMYRGWYHGKREFGSAIVPWEFCQCEWSAQFLGDQAFHMTEMEKENLRWEAAQFREGKLWSRNDYPHRLSSRLFDDRHTIIARYLTDNWRAFRTWGVSANSPWEYNHYWRTREGVGPVQRALDVDWDHLQRPGISPDYVDQQPDIMVLGYERDDWEATADAQAVYRNNLPLLAYIAGKPARFTSKDHNFYPDETVEKQVVVINNSRETVTCDWSWSVNLPEAASARGQVTVPTGDQVRVPVPFPLAGAKPGRYVLSLVAAFSTGETQEDSFAIDVMPRRPAPRVTAEFALLDPKGETVALLEGLGVCCQRVEAGADLSPYQVLVIGKGALTADGPGPDLGRVREGLKVIVFEQASEALERRLGFRVTEYGLRQVFPRVPDHPLLAGLAPEHLCDWRGEATLLPPRLHYHTDRELFNGAPTVKWCGIDVTRLWRCGNRGNVASVLIEKPARGNFLPLVDGGYSLQYSPLLEYREGQGMMLFCQLDVVGRTEDDPAAETLLRNLLDYVAAWQPAPLRRALFVGHATGSRYLEQAGVAFDSYAGGELTADQVLIVAPGAASTLAGSAAAIRAWLAAGGHLLAIGLDDKQANAFLPFAIGTRREEHISAWFEPFPAGSPLAGVGPADVVIRDPRELPLLSRGATIVGNGVLGVREEANVVFCQLVPWEFDWRKPRRGADAPPLMNLKRTFRRSSVLLARLLANLGVAGSTPVLTRVREPAGAEEKRWVEGLYLDTPEEWDDPYRFFRW